MKDNQFKIDTKKRNIIIAVIVAVLIIAGIITGVILYNRNNKPTAEPATETTEVEELTKAPTEDETKTAEDTEEPVTTEESEDTEEPENTEKTVNSTEEVRRASEATQEVIPTEEPTTQAHTHTWSEATCTSPKTCTTCGATEGLALGHDFSVDQEETIHHDAEYAYEIHLVCACNKILDGMTGDQVNDHMHTNGCGSYGKSSIQVLVSEAWDEVVHHWFCSRCGATQ